MKTYTLDVNKLINTLNDNAIRCMTDCIYDIDIDIVHTFNDKVKCQTEVTDAYSLVGNSFFKLSLKDISEKKICILTDGNKRISYSGMKALLKSIKEKDALLIRSFIPYSEDDSYRNTFIYIFHKLSPKERMELDGDGNTFSLDNVGEIDSI